jgi:DNA-binding CsgD family transcriptional regulator
MTPIVPDFVRHTARPLPCTTDPQLFHLPDDGANHRGPAARKRLAAAIALCRTCPAMQACRAWALEHGETGVWGAQGDEDRTKAAGDHPGPERPSQADCGTSAGAQRHRRRGARPCARCLRAETNAKTERERAKTAAWPPQLTPRERETLALWCAGLTIRELRAELGISARSIGGYMLQLRRKLRVDTDHELGPTARALGLIEPAAEYGKAA